MGLNTDFNDLVHRNCGSLRQTVQILIKLWLSDCCKVWCDTAPSRGECLGIVLDLYFTTANSDILKKTSFVFPPATLRLSVIFTYLKYRYLLELQIINPKWLQYKAHSAGAEMHRSEYGSCFFFLFEHFIITCHHLCSFYCIYQWCNQQELRWNWFCLEATV